MNKTQINHTIKQIEKHMARVAKERDSLDVFIDELEGLKENCLEAYDNLQCARDALSQLV